MMDERYLITVSDDSVIITELGTWKNLTLKNSSGGKLIKVFKSGDSRRLYSINQESDHLLTLDVEDIINKNQSSFSANNLLSAYINNFVIPIFATNSSLLNRGNSATLWKELSLTKDNGEVFFILKPTYKKKMMSTTNKQSLASRESKASQEKVDSPERKALLASLLDSKSDIIFTSQENGLVQMIEPKSGAVLQSFSFDQKPLITPSHYKTYFPITAFTSANGKYLFVTDGLFFKIFDTSYFMLLYEFGKCRKVLPRRELDLKISSFLIKNLNSFKTKKTINTPLHFL